MDTKDQDTTHKQDNMPANKDKQGVDKTPGEEQGKQEQVTPEDLKGKKTDRDITQPSDAPSEQETNK